jgi:hypothetical protein
MNRLIACLGLAVLSTGCAVGPTLADCEEPPITNINILFVKNNEISVSPGNAITVRGNVLRFKLTGDKETQVNISGKSADSVWISGSGKGGDFIYVCVSPMLEKKTYSYDIKIPGVGELDPEVTVRR